MTGQVVLRRRPVLLSKKSTISSSSGSARFAEVAGGTAAECAVICCCCPCGILHLAILALYTLPAGICKRMLRKKQRQQQRLLKRGLVPRRRSSCSCGCEGVGGGAQSAADRQMFPIGFSAVAAMAAVGADEMVEGGDDEEKDVMRTLEKEMWDTFYSTGFWRSPSQRDN